MPPNVNAPQTKLRNALKIDGVKIDEKHVFDISVQSDLDHPDMASITLSNGVDADTPRFAQSLKEGAPVELRLWLQAVDAQNAPIIFAGELVGLEPVYSAGQPPRVIVRCFNALHRLSRGRKSRTFVDLSDAQIVKQVVEGAYKGLKVDFGDLEPKTKHPHIYQHNQTDLEFLRHRAARLGYELLVEADNKTLYFRPPTRKKIAEPLEYRAQGNSSLQSFYPRLSTAHQVSGVRIRAWDPETKKPIIGVADPKDSTLGTTSGHVESQNIMTVDVDVPVHSKEEADNVARSILLERQMQYIVAEAVCTGNYLLRPGNVVTIKVDDERFAGDYYIAALSHAYVSGDGPASGFRTRLKLKRDAKGPLKAADATLTPVKYGQDISG